MTRMRDDLLASLVEAVARLNDRIVSPITEAQALAVIVEWLTAHAAELRGPAGDGLPPTEAQVAAAVVAWFAAHSESLRGRQPTADEIAAAVNLWMALNEHRLHGAPGRDPTAAEIASAAAAWLERHRESLKGSNGRGIERMVINNMGDLLIYYTDGTSQNLGNKWRGHSQQSVQHVSVRSGGGIGEARVIQLIEELMGNPSSDTEYTHLVTNITASGNTTLITPTGGKALHIVKVQAIPDPDVATFPQIKFSFVGGVDIANGTPCVMRQKKVGAVDQALRINLTETSNVDVTVIYEEITP